MNLLLKRLIWDKQAVHGNLITVHPQQNGLDNNLCWDRRNMCVNNMSVNNMSESNNWECLRECLSKADHIEEEDHQAD